MPTMEIICSNMQDEWEMQSVHDALEAAGIDFYPRVENPYSIFVSPQDAETTISILDDLGYLVD